MKAAQIGTVALTWLAAASLVSAQTAGPAPGESLSQSYRASQARNVEYQKIAPFKVMDNLYYVGPGNVAVWLLPTSAGLILFDAAQEPYVDYVLDNIRKVGFDPKNIKYILLTHGHLDHFGGATKIQKLSGARVALTEVDWNFMATNEANAIKNGRPPKRFHRNSTGIYGWAPRRRDRTPRDITRPIGADSGISVPVRWAIADRISSIPFSTRWNSPVPNGSRRKVRV